MKTEWIPVLTALEEGMSLPFSMVRSMSTMSFGRVPEEIDLEELLEARFFDSKIEIRLFWSDDQLCSIKLTEEDTDDLLYETFWIENPVFGSQFTVCNILDSDIDGQTYIKDTRLVHWKGENEDG